MALKTYNEVIQYLDKQKRKKHLLLGNGFSMSYDSKIFSYNALSKFIEKIDDDIIRQLFNIVNTNNFELVMQQLDNFYEMAKIFKLDAKTLTKIKKASVTLKKSLINAVKDLHPEHVFKISEEKSLACATFLSPFLTNNGNIFTTNYDLLLYWVLMRNEIDNKVDGFGKDLLTDSDEYINPNDLQYSDLHWGKNKEEQNVHYLHGALPLFDTGIDIIKEVYTSEHLLLENIKSRLDKKEYPIFVTAGNGREKLKNIMHNKYLTYCFEKFSEINGSLITFGFNFGEYDEHIIEAINKASKFNKNKVGKLFSIYIGVYSENDLKHITSIEKKFKCKVNIFDAKSANVWG